MCAILTFLAGYVMGSYLPLGCVGFHRINWTEMVLNFEL